MKPRRIAGFDLGTDFASCSQDVSREENWASSGETLELVVTTDPDRMGEAVLSGLMAPNAAFASVSARYSSR